MRWQRRVSVVDAHAEGEVGRVITGGVPEVPGATMFDKKRHLETRDDSLRRFVLFEPRGGAAVIHDAGDHGGRYVGLAEALAADGGAVALPDMRGHEFYVNLQRLKPDLADRVAFIIDGALSHEQHTMLKNSGVPRLDKPFQPQQVRDLVAELV